MSLEEFKRANPDAQLAELSAGGHTITVKKPGRADYRRFKVLAMDNNKRADAGETLVRSCTVDPDPKGLDAIFEDMPFLSEQFAGKLLDMMGAGLEVEKKDLSP